MTNHEKANQATTQYTAEKIAELQSYKSLFENMADTQRRIAEKTAGLLAERDNLRRRAEALGEQWYGVIADHATKQRVDYRAAV